jgi:peptide/nickel transport system substrate-binding protein
MHLPFAADGVSKHRPLWRSAWLGLLFCATALNPGYAHAQPKSGGTLNLLVEPEPTSLVTLTTTAGSAVKVSPKVNEGLLTYDFDLKPKPQLATGWAISPNGLEYRFTLRQGVKWHDGKPFTSADVAFSILALKEVNPRGRATFANVVEVRTPDPYTAVIVLAKPAPYLLLALAAGESPIVPKHVYERSKIDQNPALNAPIGTGPFKFKEWVKGSYILYERNPDYWDQPKPYIQRLVVRLIPDAAARSAAFESGAVDLGGETPVPLSEVDRLKADPRLAIETRGYEYSPTQTRLEFNLDNPYLKNLKVRQAIAHAINRKVLLGTVWYGYGADSPTPIPPTLKRFHESVDAYPYDLKNAEALLDEAGFKRGADGVRFRLTHDFLPYGDNFKRVAEYLKPALAKIGIEVTIRSQDFSTYIRRVYTDRDFDFTNNSMSTTFDPTIGVQRLYWSKNFKKGVPFSNGSHYSSARVDELLETASVETDAARRAQLFKEFQKQVVVDLPDLGLIEIQHVTLYNKKVKNHTVDALGLNGSLADVYLEK